MNVTAPRSTASFPFRNGRSWNRAATIKHGKYTGDKWGGKYLRAPDIYWTILEKGKDKLVRTEDIAEMRYGIKTGVNEFFYLESARARQLGIEEMFLRPVIKSPRECRGILIDPSRLKYNLFMCNMEKEDLDGTAALEYIQWGESLGYHERPSCKGRVRWYDLGRPMTFDWLMLIFRGQEELDTGKRNTFTTSG